MTLPDFFLRLLRHPLLNLLQMPFLPISCLFFLFPKSLCLDIKVAVRKFWWGFSQNKRHHLSFLSWDSFFKSKALGGLGLRSMEFLNNLLLARLGWKLTTNQLLLWVNALRGKYLTNRISFSGCSIFEIRTQFLFGVRIWRLDFVR
jgi:hypothetical protein